MLHHRPKIEITKSISGFAISGRKYTYFTWIFNDLELKTKTRVSFYRLDTDISKYTDMRRVFHGFGSEIIQGWW